MALSIISLVTGGSVVSTRSSKALNKSRSSSLMPRLYLEQNIGGVKEKLFMYPSLICFQGMEEGRERV